jgi:hypothetical protein
LRYSSKSAGKQLLLVPPSIMNAAKDEFLSKSQENQNGLVEVPERQELLALARSVESTVDDERVLFPPNAPNVTMSSI